MSYFYVLPLPKLHVEGKINTTWERTPDDERIKIDSQNLPKMSWPSKNMQTFIVQYRNGNYDFQ